MSEEREGDLGKQLNELRPKLSPTAIRAVVIAVVAIITVLTSFYTIEPEEVGLVLRFGKYASTSDPGLHFKVPFGIDRVLKVPIQRQLKEEFGFRTLKAGIRTQYSQRDFQGESNMLTGDLNAALVEWVVQYRITDPYKYLFRVRNMQETFRAMSEATMRAVIGDRTINEVLTVGRAEVALEVNTQLQALCDDYETGIKVEQVVLQNVTPPDPVRPSFNDVNEAEQEREKLINQAQSEYNKIIPRAEGQALQTVQVAEGYALDRVNRAQGDATRFNALYAAYAKAPDVTKKRIFLETMGEILPRVESKLIIDDELNGILPLLNLDTAGNREGD